MAMRILFLFTIFFLHSFFCQISLATYNEGNEGRSYSLTTIAAESSIGLEQDQLTQEAKDEIEYVQVIKEKLKQDPSIVNLETNNQLTTIYQLAPAALRVAAAEGKLDLVKLLLNFDPYLNNWPDYTKNIALSNAVLRKRKDIVETLLQYPLQKEFTGKILHTAARHNDVEIMKMLLNTKQFDPNGKNETLETPLNIALNNENINVALELIPYMEKSLLNEQVKGRSTYLIDAICLNEAEVVQKLIQYGANVNQKFNNYTPLDFANTMDNPDIINMLKNNGAH